MPHFIYRYPASASAQPTGSPPGRREHQSGDAEQPVESRECANGKLHEWALRQHGKGQRSVDSSWRPQSGHQAQECSGEQGRCDNGGPNDAQPTTKGSPRSQADGARFTKRDVSLTEKYIEFALVLGQDIFERRNSSDRLQVVQDAVQIVNCLDLYFRLSTNTRVSLIYLETWAHGDQIEPSSDAKQTLYNFLDYSTRKLYKVPMDAAHLLTGARRLGPGEMGVSIPDSICSARAVSVAQDSSVFEPFVAAASMAHMLGHNLGMEHDPWPGAAPRAPGRRPAAGARPPHADSDQDNHEDEIKRSRSLAAPELGDVLLAGSGECHHSNCLMSERFVYLQPPVYFGQLIQQEPANGTSQSQPLELELEQANEDGLMDGLAASQSQSPPPPPVLLAGALPFRFSAKSVETYLRLLRSERAICLFNKPNQLEDFHKCGNGIVDKGEDCDCGTFQECRESDSCCDPVTCKYKLDADCIKGACCDRCKLRPRGHVCRRARGECDLAELCDGKSGECAPDVHKQNGQPCQAGAGFCYLGSCPIHDAQCAELWGADSRRAEPICYAAMNTNGTVRGNCGHQDAPVGPATASASPVSASGPPTRAKFRRCETEHMMCGTLQCQLGDMRPVSEPIHELSPPATGSAGQKVLPTSTSAHSSQQQAEFSKKTLTKPDGTQVECKAITSLPGNIVSSSTSQSAPTPRSSSISYVLDGTKCAPNRVCVNRTCLPIELVYRDSFELCPRDERGRTCSGNGVCSSANRCHCEPSWTGRDCSQRWTAPVEMAPMILDTSEQEPVNEMSTGRLPVQVRVQVALDPALGLFNSTDSSVLLVTPGAPLVSSWAPPPPLASTTSAPSHTSSLPNSTASQSSNVVEDKKAHDALSAPTLVFILVSVVAAVYVGFALMANCYRHKGLIKPDKVLRHHRMNCKLDALRSSLIAKRLADAEAAASGFESVSAAVAPLSYVGGCQHLAPLMRPNCTTEPGRYLMDAHYLQADQDSFETLEQPVDAYAFEQPTTSGDHIPLLVSSSGQQLVGAPGQGDNPVMRAYASRALNVDKRPRYPAAGPTTNNYRQANGANSSVSWFARTANPSSTAALLEQANQTFESHINRAASLGNVHRRSMSRLLSAPDNEHDDEHQQDDEPVSDEFIEHYGRAAGRKSMTSRTKGALATPVRTNRAKQTRASRRISSFAGPEDSCSALSSPEQKLLVVDPYLSEAENPMPARQTRPSRFPASAMPTSVISQQPHQALPGYHEEAILGAMSACRQQVENAANSEDLPLPPLPPPPPAAANSKLELEESDMGEPSDADLVGHPLSWASPVRSVGQPRQAQPDGRKVRQVPLNEPLNLDRSEQVSLIAQLRQLERVQSIHERQVSARLHNAGASSTASGEKLSSHERLHEFFSLPLSVQLSALLARSLAESRSTASDLNSTTPIDEYLNTLNNSNVAASSRRSFRTAKEGASAAAAGISQQPLLGQTQVGAPLASTGGPSAAPSSRSGTFKKNQVKLHNLRALIDRLQKLHNQTILQQQLDELNDELEDNLSKAATSAAPTLSTRQSTLGRASRQSSLGRQRPIKQVVDDFFEHPREPNKLPLGLLSSTGPRRRTVTRVHDGSSMRSKGGHRHESVYSLSDSEDGNLVSRVFIQSSTSTYQRTGVDPRATEPVQYRAYTDTRRGSVASPGNATGAEAATNNLCDIKAKEAEPNLQVTQSVSTPTANPKPEADEAPIGDGQEGQPRGPEILIVKTPTSSFDNTTTNSSALASTVEQQPTAN